MIDSNEPVIMVLSGEYDLSAKKQLRGAFDSLAHVDRAILDFTAVTYIDSTVLSELMRLSQIRAEARLDGITVVAANSNIRRLFAMVQMDGLLRLVDSLDDAVSGDGKPAMVKYVLLAGDDPGS